MRPFCFYYPENLELLQSEGARLRFFSPLAGEKLPEEAMGLYLGGGFPEAFAEELAGAEEVKRSIREGIETGLPTYAEGGGFMYLSQFLEDREKEAIPDGGGDPGPDGNGIPDCLPLAIGKFGQRRTRCCWRRERRQEGMSFIIRVYWSRPHGSRPGRRRECMGPVGKGLLREAC